MKSILFECQERFGTPFYLYDFAKIEQSFREYQAAFEQACICYALKANSNLSVLNFLSRMGSGADCVSINEVKKALLSGVPKEKIIFSGVGKQAYEIREALQRDIWILNVESEFELNMIERIAAELGVVARISFRMNPDVSANTHSYISTGIKESKFGLSANEVFSLANRAKDSPNLAPICLHTHIGSQILELDALILSVKKLAEFAERLLESGVNLEYLDIGGGVGVDYEGGRKSVDLREYSSAAKNFIEPLGLGLICEPGRYIMAQAGVLGVSVLGSKSNGPKNFVITDGAMNDLMRPSLYGAKHPVSFYSSLEFKDDDKLKSEEISQIKKEKAYDIVGPICESGDFLAKDVALSNPLCGDIIAIECAGAYGFSMANNYNLRGRPCEVGLIDGELVLLRERESFGDLMEDLLDSKSIGDMRFCVDIIDDKIISLIDRRIKLAKSIGALKSKEGLEVEVQAREREILGRIEQTAHNKDEIKEIFAHIFKICKRVQK